MSKLVTIWQQKT